MRLQGPRMSRHPCSWALWFPPLLIAYAATRDRERECLDLSDKLPSVLVGSTVTTLEPALESSRCRVGHQEREPPALDHPNALRSSIRAVRSSGGISTNRRMPSRKARPGLVPLPPARLSPLFSQSFSAINSCSAAAIFMRASVVALSAIVRVRQHLVQTLVQTETSASFEPCFSGVSAPPSDVRDAEVAGSPLSWQW